MTDCKIQACFFVPIAQVTFRAALFAALLFTHEHLEIRSALFLNKTFQVPKNAKLTSHHIIFKLNNWEHKFWVTRKMHYEQKLQTAHFGLLSP